ncbi:hypothetical protein [Brevundimonas subvibrioides]|uniref:hypothetical protein n=1 Tax=Brevundimonas subvibrioides TaxID=74313 RepID=UPI0022B41D3F|nr:hypothetical protein [Brevundimonas subvibrioides]
MTTTNQTRRHVMNMAWGLYREAVAQGDRLYTFPQALAGAWRFVKRLAAAKPRIQFNRSLVARSAVGRHYGTRAYVGGQSSFAYQASAMGS